MIPSIPKSLLPHSVKIIKSDGADVWGSNSDISEINVHYVRVEPIKSQRFALNGDFENVSAKIFYDCRNSVPKNVNFSTGDIINFNGTEFRISSVATHYADSITPHHLEVMLV